MDHVTITFSLVRTCNWDQLGKTVKKRNGWPGYISQVGNGLPAACTEHVLNDMNVVSRIIFMEAPFHPCASIHS